MSTARKVFHCVVDDTALSTNITEIKKWAASAAITLIVPLYTLERLHGLRKAAGQVGANARESVRFLDRVTSGKDSIPTESVVLQGPLEQLSWEECEEYFLPEFEEPFDDGEEIPSDAEASRENSEEPASDTSDGKPVNDLSQMLLDKLNFKKNAELGSVTSAGSRSGHASPSSGSSRTSPEYVPVNLATDGPTAKKGNKERGHRRTRSGLCVPAVPTNVKVLLSSILWRLHRHVGVASDPAAGVHSCILVTNDRATQMWAQKFGIMAKTIFQLRTAILYEEKEAKNRTKYMEKAQVQTHQGEPKTLLSYENDSDEDELVFVPRGRGRAPVRSSPARGGATRKPVAPTNGAVAPVPSQPIDPDSFSRSFVAPKEVSTPEKNAHSGTPRGTTGSSRRYTAHRGASRGVRGGGRGRGKLFVP